MKIALLAHSNHGNMVMRQAVKCIQAIEENYGHHFSINHLNSLKRDSAYWLNEETLKSCRNSDAILSSVPITKEKFYKSNNEKSINLVQALDCQATVSPILAFPDQLYLKPKSAKGADFVIFSALKSGQYKVDLSPELKNSDIYTPNPQGIHQLFHLAFKTAKNRNKKLTVVLPHGPNKNKLWSATLGEISLSYPMVTASTSSMEDMITMLLHNPEELDCIFADDLWGPILQTQAKEWSEMKNLLPIAHTGMGINIFEPLCHFIDQGSSQDPNPIALIYAIALMLSRFGLQEEAGAIQLAINSAAQRNMFTREQRLPTQISCEQLGDYIAAAIIDVEDIGALNDENIDLGKSTII